MRRVSKADIDVAGSSNSDVRVDEVSVEAGNVGTPKSRVSTNSLDVSASNISGVDVDQVLSESLSIDDRSSKITSVGLDSLSKNISDVYVDEIVVEVLAPTVQPESPEDPTPPPPPEFSGWGGWGNVFSRVIHYDLIKPHRYRGTGESEKFVSYIKNSQIDIQTNGLQIKYLDHLYSISYSEFLTNTRIIQRHRFHIDWRTRSVV